jgi:sugar phosphate isomerase/epimerase
VNRLLYGYNTNGFAHHRLDDCLIILHRLGYRSVALTLDYHALNPYDPAWVGPKGRWRDILRLLRTLRLHAVIETGARFLLDPWRKHAPTLLDSPRQQHRRLDFLKRCCDLARRLEIPLVSFWSGAAPEGIRRDVLWRRLVNACRILTDYASARGIRLALEPEPGMFLDTLASFAEFQSRFNHPCLGLTMDLGHLHCQREGPIDRLIAQWKDHLWNVHIEDMRVGVHDHLMFGDGEIDFTPVLKALSEADYRGGVHVELSRHSHDAVNIARAALTFLHRHQPNGSRQTSRRRGSVPDRDAFDQMG